MRPNILWIVTTQWRAQALGFAGDSNARTPCLDALAAESINFCEAVTPHPAGPFARAALLTGIPCPENGVRDYFDPLPGEARTIAHEMNERGYETAFFGKWHLGRRSTEAPLVGEIHARTVVPAGERGGFGFWEGFESGFLLNDPWLHGTALPEPVRFEGYQSDVVCGRAADWIRACAKEWFCIVSLEPPHPPYGASASGMTAAPADAIELRPNVPRTGPAEARARRELSGYYAHVEATDWAIGRIVNLVSASPIPTVIFFTSVHGDMHGSQGLFRKGWPYEESIRVPLLVRSPFFAGSEAGQRNNSAVSLLDLPRMTLACAGDGGAGRNEVAFSEYARISMPSEVRHSDQCDRPWRGIRNASRKLVLSENRMPWLFYNLERDPFETKNLVSDPDGAAEIAALSRLA